MLKSLRALSRLPPLSRVLHLTYFTRTPRLFVSKFGSGRAHELKLKLYPNQKGFSESRQEIHYPACLSYTLNTSYQFNQLSRIK